MNRGLGARRLRLDSPKLLQHSLNSRYVLSRTRDLRSAVTELPAIPAELRVVGALNTHVARFIGQIRCKLAHPLLTRQPVVGAEDLRYIKRESREVRFAGMRGSYQQQSSEV